MLISEQPNDEVIADHGGPQPGIDPIGEATVARQQPARVLRAYLALDHALSQVAQGSDGG